jgi:hypothetical protein
MADPPPPPHPPTAIDPDAAVRRVQHDAASLARRLNAEVDIHQREARFVLERAGKLSRQMARGARRPPAA